MNTDENINNMFYHMTHIVFYIMQKSAIQYAWCTNVVPILHSFAASNETDIHLSRFSLWYKTRAHLSKLNKYITNFVQHIISS